MYHPWKVASTSNGLLRSIEAKCGHKTHAACEGINTAHSGRYTPQFSDGIHNAWKRHVFDSDHTIAMAADWYQDITIVSKQFSELSRSSYLM